MGPYRRYPHAGVKLDEALRARHLAAILHSLALNFVVDRGFSIAQGLGMNVTMSRV
jgi:hypothetical protein